MMTLRPAPHLLRIALYLVTALTFVGCVTEQQRHTRHIQLVADIGTDKTQSATLAQALVTAEQTLATGLKTPEQRVQYNQAVEDAVILWNSQSKKDQHHHQMKVQNKEHQYTLHATWPKNLRFDSLIAAQSIKGQSLRENMVREGVGAAFVANWKNTPERQKNEPFMSPVGYFASVTVTINFKKTALGKREAILVIHDANNTEKVRLHGNNHTLTFNQSALAEHLLAHKSDYSAIGALFRPSKYLDEIKLQCVSPPNPDRIPIILTHGLASEPRTWQNVYNELRSDPVIRKRFQIYFFKYPSGVPVLYSAAELRAKLQNLQVELNRHGTNRYNNQMLLVGHSLGGLITKTQVQDSGNDMWLRFVDYSKKHVKLNKAQLQSLQKYLIFKPNPNVSRVVFIATPHRGSDLADYWIVRQLRKLIRVPGTIIRAPFIALDQTATQQTADSAISKLFESGIPTSMENLSPESKYVKDTVNLPLRKGLKVHSIVGNLKGLDLTDPECSDGVVPYTSAHIEGIKSELVVPYGHSAHEHPMAIEELRRIIHQHLKECR